MLLMVNVIPVKIYAMLSNYIIYFSIALLLLTVVLKFAGIVQGSGRTLNLGPLSFQPSEIAKIALIIYSAKILAVKQKTRKDLFVAFKKIMFFTVIICGLIFISNFSTASLLFATIIAMMFVGRIPIKYLIMVFAAGIMFVIFIYFTADFVPDSLSRVHTIKGRIERFINNDTSSETGITQADYAKLAIYEGGIFGKGPGYSDVSNYMAAAYNDFIFAIIVEEYGFIIGTGLMFLYLIFFFRGVIIVRRTTRTFPAFLVTGFTILLVFQAMINIGVSSGALPVTGQPLPWISLGGTSLIFTSIAFGCILSVSHQNQVDREIQKQPVQVNVPDEDYEMEK
ncbi:MAG: FtsW/RodA/SpoVE family cell cycle protein, partial [Bacteroidales bacterium]|jgi:cell division protein FtsW|nr:FtsW/RodA/SpoVE family cell cycle protein [Bacteroidales bacterium]